MVGFGEARLPKYPLLVPPNHPKDADCVSPNNDKIVNYTTEGSGRQTIGRTSVVGLLRYNGSTVIVLGRFLSEGEALP